MTFPSTLYAVKSLLTGQYLTRGPKFLWANTGAAKNAWLASVNYRNRPKHFDDQAEWVVVPMLVVPAS